MKHIREVCISLSGSGVTHTSVLDWFNMTLVELAEWSKDVEKYMNQLKKEQK